MSARTQAARQAPSQFAWHRDQHRSWRRVALILAAVSAAQAAALAGYIHYHATVYITVAATPDGRAAWSIEFPMLVTFQAGNRINHQKLTTRVLVMRVPLSENAAGIGIQQLIATRTGA